MNKYLAKLRRGEHIMNWSHHHSAMAELKAELGSKRPPGLELSLVRPDSPSAYDGYGVYKGARRTYRLSTDPADYAWETRSENEQRKSVEIRQAPVTSGRLASIASSGGKVGGPKGMHIRWHVNRGIISPSCSMCKS
jgi:hypothetical protein